MWLTWRQFRAQGVVVLLAVGLVVVALAVTGSGVSDLRRADPGAFLRAFAGESTYRAVYFGSAAAVYALPAIIGAFWGAPLIARELEAGTHRLVWTQSVSRNRWLASKLGLIAVAAIVAGLVSLAVTWWCNPLDTTVNHTAPDAGVLNITRLSGVLSGARGLVPVGYAVLALLIGVTAGLVIRRAVPAMALTFAAVIAVQVFMPLVVQPHLLPAEQQTITITPENLRGMMQSTNGDVREILVRLNEPGAWVLSNETVDAAGNTVGEISAGVADCGPGSGKAAGGPKPQCFDQLAAAGYRQRVAYQPADRYWQLQWIQTGILLGTAGLLTGFCFWRIRRDLT